MMKTNHSGPQRWKGTDKPAGAIFYSQNSYRHEIDCPKCKHGTLVTSGEKHMFCIDCGAKFTISFLEKLGVIKSK